MEPKGVAYKETNVFRRTFSSLFLYRNYRLLWMGSWTEHMGEWMETTALLWVLNDMTHSPVMGTLMVALRSMPTVIFAFIGGIAADRMNRRTLLMLSLLGSATISAGTALLVYSGMIQPWHILLNGGLSGVVTSFNHPARQTLVPNMIKKEHLLNAITLDSGSVTASRIIGAPLAGLIMVWFGGAPVLGLKCVGAILAIVWLSFIKAPPTPVDSKKKSPVQNFVQGMHYVGGHPDVLTQILLYLLPYFVTNTYTGLLPYFATDVLHVGPQYYGFMNAAPGAGALTMTLMLASLGHLKRKALFLLLGGICQGAAMVMFALSPIYALSLFLLFLVGGSNTVFMTLNNTVIQELIPDQMRGRVMSLREVSSGIGPGGSIISGQIAAVLGAPIALSIAGGFSIVVLAGILIFTPKGRQKAPSTPPLTGARNP